MLRECNRILRPSGKLVIGLPIEDGVYSRLRMDYFGGGEGHLYSFSLRNLNKLLGLTGFICERTVCHLPRLGNRTSVWNERLHRIFGTRLYSLSAAYWCVARKISNPVADQQLSDYFEPVSYTHLDVYKRQSTEAPLNNSLLGSRVSTVP